MERKIPKEADIVINNIELTFSESMSVRVAIDAYLAELSDPNYFGSDDTGIATTKNHKENLLKVRELIFKSL